MLEAGLPINTYKEVTENQVGVSVCAGENFRWQEALCGIMLSHLSPNWNP